MGACSKGEAIQWGGVGAKNIFGEVIQWGVGVKHIFGEVIQWGVGVKNFFGSWSYSS